MIAHALTILLNELNRYLIAYGSDNNPNTDTSPAILANLSEGLIMANANTGIPRGKLVLSVVNIQEEKTLKNQPAYVRNDARLSVTYENPPIFLNFKILMTATHSDYLMALVMLSRGLLFFQHRTVFTQDTVDLASLTLPPALANPLDQLEMFRLTCELYSPTMEEVNHLWGTLGGKQYPFALYILRALDLKFRTAQPERSVITEVSSNFFHKN